MTAQEQKFLISLTHEINFGRNSWEYNTIYTLTEMDVWFNVVHDPVLLRNPKGAFSRTVLG